MNQNSNSSSSSIVPTDYLDGMNLGFPAFFSEVSDDLGRYADITRKVQKIRERFSPDFYPRVLDVCCGAGHFAKAMTDVGYTVHGIDLSPVQIELARERCKNASFEIGDMRTPPTRSFDFVLNTYSSFGYMPTAAEDVSVLKAWHNALRPGGILLMELTDLERAKLSFGFPKNTITRRSGEVNEYLMINWQTNILLVSYEKEGHVFRTFTRLYTAEELADILVRVGFDLLTMAGDFGTKQKIPQDRLVLTCRK